MSPGNIMVGISLFFQHAAHGKAASSEHGYLHILLRQARRHKESDLVRNSAEVCRPWKGTGMEPRSITTHQQCPPKAARVVEEPVTPIVGRQR